MRDTAGGEEEVFPRSRVLYDLPPARRIRQRGEPNEARFAPVTDRLGNYKIERRDDGTHWNSAEARWE